MNTLLVHILNDIIRNAEQLLERIKRKFAYSRFNREELQRDLWHSYLKDKFFNNDLEDKLLYKVIHCGAYYSMYDIKEYKTKENIPYATKYSDLERKYVPNIDLEYPNNIEYIYEKFKKDILSSF